MDQNSKIRAVETYIQALCEHDLNAIRALYTIDARLEDPAGTEPRIGIDAIVGFYEEGFSSGLKAKLTGPVRVAANYAVFPFIVELKDHGMEIDVIDQFTFDESGKVTAMTAFWGPENTRIG